MLLSLAGIAGMAASAQDAADRAGDGLRGVALALTLDGVVGPANADYVVRGLHRAVAQDAELVILRMDTPGGLDSSMRAIIREILASQVPVATFVTPAGARAASAGTYILYASHVAAMTPGTNLGAATPVAIGGGGLPFDRLRDEPGDGEEEGSTPRPGPANPGEAKAINDAVAYIRGLAELRDRNVDWAERAVREAASLTATEAAREGVIDFTAADIDDLLVQADGRTVRVGQADRVLQTRGLAVEEVPPDWRTRLLSIITNPNVALILMMIGMYGLIFEFMNPGSLVPGTIGGISLVVGLYALAVLPVTYAGIALIALGAVLIVAEAFAPSFGVLGIGGTIAFALGAALLFDSEIPGLSVSLPMIGGIAVASLVLSLLVARLAYLSRRRKVVSGREEMVGATAQVLDWSGTAGHVFTHGERWQAVSDGPLAVGQEVVVQEVDGLTLRIAETAARKA